MINDLARKLLELDQDELETVLKAAKDENDEVIKILEQSLEDL